MTKHPTLALLAYSLLACQDNLSHPVGPTPYEPEAPQPLTCVPNLDGQLDASELAPTLGVSATFLINPVDARRTFDPTGEVDASGRRIWDLSLPDTDPVIEITARALTDTWYAADFPSDAFVAPLDAAQTLDGIYRHDSAGLTLLGIASTAASPPEGQTLWRYDAPVLLYRFPITVGARWTSVGEVRDGLVRGLPYAGRDTYTFEVLDAGALVLPDMTFSQVLRVRSTLVSQPAVGQSQTRHQVSWLFECFGEVARATSTPNDPDPNFTVAAELRRLGL
jgi:hypothetical protein